MNYFSNYKCSINYDLLSGYNVNSCLLIFQPYELELLSTHPERLEMWYCGFTVMPLTGLIVLTGSETWYGPCSVFVYNFENGTLSKTKNICLPCGERKRTYLTSLMINGREQLVVSCKHCVDIKLLDLQTEEWTVAFSGVAGKLHDSGNGRLFVDAGNSILQLDYSGPAFKGPMKTVHPHIGWSNMCYIPPPVDVLVLSDEYSLKVVALSFDKNEVIWEFSFKNVGIMSFHPNCVLFLPENNVLLVVDSGRRKEALIVKPENGCEKQKIDLSEMGSITDLAVFQGHIVMLHIKGDEGKISYLHLLGI